MVYTVAAFACSALIVVVSGGWQRNWAGRGGRARIEKAATSQLAAPNIEATPTAGVKVLESAAD